MSTDSGIEWTDATWNPVTGCTRVSAGCDHCYAVPMTRRLEGAARGAVGNGALRSHAQKYVGLTVKNGAGDWHFNGTVRTHDDALTVPLGWKKPKRIFVNSMSDLFHPKVPFNFIDKAFAVMALTPQHTYQILTKRPQRMAEYMNTRQSAGGMVRLEPGLAPVGSPDHVCEAWHRALFFWPPANVWLGCSVEDQRTADERIPHLLKCHATVRFLSCEPLLGPIDLRLPEGCRGCNHPGNVVHRETCTLCDGTGQERWIDWIILGGESGPGARPMHPGWARSIRDQCAAARVAFFFKQWGAWAPVDGLEWRGSRSDLYVCDWGEMGYVGKKAAGRLLDGREHNAFPQCNRRGAEAAETDAERSVRA